MSPREPSNPRAKMLSCAILHSTVLSRSPSSQKVQNREAGSVAYRSYYSFPPTGSSFVALSRFFSSSVFLLHPLTCLLWPKAEGLSKCLQEPHRAISEHWSSYRPATPKSHSRQENSLSFLVCELMKINWLNFHHRTAVTGNNTFLENPIYWQKKRESWLGTPTVIPIWFQSVL